MYCSDIDEDVLHDKKDISFLFAVVRKTRYVTRCIVISRSYT